MPQVLYRKSIDDIIPLAALEALHRVDTDIVQRADAILVNGIADGRYLIAVWHDDSNALLHVKLLSAQEVGLIYDGGYHAGFYGVGLR